jgi:hypothetical protein
MHAEDSTLEAPQLNLPADLLAEVSRRASARQTDFKVDGWKPSLLERIASLFGLG